MTVTLIGISVLLTLVAPVLTPDANSIASTISDVAAGPYDWVQDLAFYILAAALLCLAYAMYHVIPSSWHWIGAILTIPIMALSIAVMAFYQEYGDGDSNENGVVIHIYLVYALGFAFLSVLLKIAVSTLFESYAR